MTLSTLELVENLVPYLERSSAQKTLGFFLRIFRLFVKGLPIFILRFDRRVSRENASTKALIFETITYVASINRIGYIELMAFNALIGGASRAFFPDITISLTQFSKPLDRVRQIRIALTRRYNVS